MMMDVSDENKSSNENNGVGAGGANVGSNPTPRTKQIGGSLNNFSAIYLSSDKDALPHLLGSRECLWCVFHRDHSGP